MANSELSARFEHWSRVVEARFGSWPTWKKLVVFMPLLIMMSAILVAILGLAAAAVQGLAHH